MAETIFGFASNHSSSKGRINFSHAICHYEVDNHQDINLILSSPKASYFPHYLANEENTVSTYNDETSKLRGFKRYFVRKEVVKEPIGDHNDNKEMVTTFRPIGAGSTFKSILRFHNLRKVEIGAIISALTFHGNNNLAFHQIGGAKAYGYGRIQISILRTSLQDGKELNKYIKYFERKMYDENRSIGDWIKSETINSLLSIGSGNNKNQQVLNYPTLDEYKERLSKLVYPKLKNEITINRFYQSFQEDINHELEEEKISTIIKSRNFKFILEYMRENPSSPQIEKLNQEYKKLIVELIEKYSNENNLNGLEQIKGEIDDKSFCNLIDEYISSIKRNIKIKKQRIYEKNVIESNPSDFGQLKKTPNEILKKFKEYRFTETQTNSIIQAIHHLIKNKDKSFFESGNLKPFQDYPWTDVKKWIGEKDAKNIYNHVK